MRPEVAEGAGAGQLALEAPREWHVWVAAGVENEAALKRPDVAQDAVCDEPASLSDRGVAEVVEPHKGLYPRLLSSLEHLLSVRRAQCERLLAVHVLSSRDRSHRDLLVQKVRRHDV